MAEVIKTALLEYGTDGRTHDDILVVYTNHAVVRNDGRTHPAFVGPMYLHWDATYRTFVDFLTELLLAINTDTITTELRLSSMMVLWYDEEKGLMKVLGDVFRDSTHLLCIKRLKENITD